MDIDLEKLRQLSKTDKAAAGALFAAIREELPEGAWSGWMRENNFRFDKVAPCLTLFDPMRYPRRLNVRKKTLPSTLPAGEIHEAARGFKAMMTKAAAEEDMALADRRRTVAFQHFKFLLGHSNLPALMKMSPDEIIGLLRKI